MKKMNSYALILVAVLVSFLGFIIENIFVGATDAKMNNRNMILPFLFGYGLAIIAIFLLFGTPEEPKFFTKPLSLGTPMRGVIYYFVISFLCVCVGEVVLGYAIEWGCDIIWWDYTRIPLHFTRYTSVPTSAAFATLIVIFMKFFFRPLCDLFSRINPTLLPILALSFTALLSLDMVNSLIHMIRYHETLILWEIHFEHSLVELIFGAT